MHRQPTVRPFEHAPDPRSAAIAAACCAAAPARRDAQSAALARPSAHARVGFERIKLPGDERVGLVGTSYLVDVPLLEGLSAGPASTARSPGSAAASSRSAAKSAWRRQLAGPLGIELGLFAGGGGGAGAPVGSGLMLRPHADRAVGLRSVRARPVGLARALSERRDRQHAGRRRLQRDQRLPLRARLAPGQRRCARAGAPASASIGSSWSADVSRAVRHAARDGSPAPRDIGTVGIRAEQSFSPNLYWGLEANGAVQSRVAGYAEYLGTLGFETEAVRNTLNVGARIGLGMAGGGGVQTDGGLFGKAAVYGVVRLSNEFGLALEAGAAGARHGDFRAAHASASLVWALDGPQSDNSAARPTRTDFSAGLERYDAARQRRQQPKRWRPAC
jgi:hypothetical protein